MSARDLLYGPYSPPRLSIGDSVHCRMHGELRVHSWSDRGAIMWPLGIREGKSPGRPSMILCCDLVRAVQQESAIAVARHWGTTWRTVRHWRRALGVERMTAGSRALASELGRADMADESPKGTAASLVPEVRRRRDAAHSQTMKGRRPDAKMLAASAKAIAQRWAAMSAEERSERSARLRMAYLKQPPERRRAVWLKVARAKADSRYESRLTRFLLEMREQGKSIATLADWLGIAPKEVSSRLRVLARQYPILADMILTDSQKRRVDVEALEMAYEGVSIILEAAPPEATTPCWSPAGAYLRDLLAPQYAVAHARNVDARYLRLAESTIVDLYQPQEEWPGYRIVDATFSPRTTIPGEA